MSSPGLQHIAAFYENLTPARLELLGEIYANDAVFTDPFNNVTGVQAIRRIFEHMFSTVHQPVFKV
ncbi:MAG: nuclear transport factor 2 family protein, partial [Pusillimonas sp.]|nr:nuclear transport factor 2 family protein [Pusillimonas sp.]